MRLKFFIVISILLGTVTLWAQGKLSEEKRKEFEAQKIAFFTQALELTPEEAAVFWPLYNEMMKKIREQDAKVWEMYRQAHKAKKRTPEQEEQQVIDMLEHEQKMLDIKKEYYLRLLKVVPAQKIARLDRTERKFHKQLFQKMCKEPDVHK